MRRSSTGSADGQQLAPARVAIEGDGDGVGAGRRGHVLGERDRRRAGSRDTTRRASRTPVWRYRPTRLAATRCSPSRGRPHGAFPSRSPRC